MFVDIFLPFLVFTNIKTLHGWLKIKIYYSVKEVKYLAQAAEFCDNFILDAVGMP